MGLVLVWFPLPALLKMETEKGKTKMLNTNTGNSNTGNWNTGDDNSGNRNTGNGNTGNSNTGYSNTGDDNTGYRNTGNDNTGNWNAGNSNTGYFNTVTPKECLVFNKKCTFEEFKNADKPSWIYVDLTVWVDELDMSGKEKEAYPSYITTGGYLKVYSSLKHAFIESWDKATEEDRNKTFNLPNFDPIVFEEIFGFNPCKQEKVTIELTVEQLKSIKHLL